jgi:hypothetical protein
MKYPLHKPKDLRGIKMVWKACAPFIQNAMAELIHRPRIVCTYRLSKERRSHIGMTFWCGNSSVGTKKFVFLDAPPEGKLVCARCEAAAVNWGLQSSSEIVGRHVHIGGVVAVQQCCKD